MKKYFWALCLGALALAGCSKDEEAAGNASIGDSKYTITSVYAFQYPSSRGSDTELCLVTDGGYFDFFGEEDFTTDYFYVDLYWDEKEGYVNDRLVEGTYTLGDDVLDEVTLCFPDKPESEYIEAIDGILTISSRKNGYSISFSGYTADGTTMNFSYSGSVMYFEW